MTTLTRRNPLAAQTDITLASETNSKDINLIKPRSITVDPGLQTRDKVSQETIAEYAEAMRDGAIFPPLTVYQDSLHYLLAKGFHRLQAHLIAFGPDEPIRCKVIRGERRDALRDALGDNAEHGLRLNREDKRKKIKIALADAEWGQWSDREIAKLCKVSHPLVAEVRREVTGNSSSDQPRTYNTRHGTQATMNTERIRQANSARSTSNTAAANDDAGGAAPFAAVIKQIGTAEPDALKPPPRLLTTDETLAVILRFIERGCNSAAPGLQLDFLRRNTEPRAYLPAVNQDRVLDIKCFREAWRQAEVLLEAEVRKANRSEAIIQRVEAEYDTANPLAAPTRSDRIQALRKLCQGLIDSLPDYGELTGDYSGTLPLRRALEPMIRKLEENQIEPKAQPSQSPTADEIEKAIRQWMAGEQRKAGATKYISPVTWWMWVLYLVPSDVGVKCSLNDFRQVIGRRFGELRDEAVRGGWQPIPDLEKETWWRAAAPKENLV